MEIQLPILSAREDSVPDVVADGRVVLADVAGKLAWLTILRISQNSCEGGNSAGLRVSGGA